MFGDSKMLEDTDVKNNDAELDYTDMMGSENPPEISGFEPDKVELSVPVKVQPDAEPEPEPEALPEPESEVEAVPVYQEPFVDEDGVEHMAPPVYDKSALPEEKPLYNQQPNKDEFLDDASFEVAQTADTESVVVSAEETKVAEDKVSTDEPVVEQSPQSERHVIAPLPDWGKNETASIDDFLSENDDSAAALEMEDAADVAVVEATPQAAEAEEQVVDTTVDDNDTDDEVPDFVRSWNNGNAEQQTLDDTVNQALDGDDDLEFDDSLDETDDVLFDDEDENVDDRQRNLSPEDIIVDDDKPAIQGAIPKFELSPEEQEEAEIEDMEAQDKVVAVEVLPDGETIVDGEPHTEDSIIADEPVEPKDDEPLVITGEEVEPIAPLNTEVEEVVAEDDDGGYQNNDDLYAREYSGYLSDEYFVVDSQSLQGEFVGDDKCNAIQINASQSSYGWGVHFDNGWFMGIRDVREYQLRHGCLPSANGEVMFGAKKMAFKNVARIVLYEVPRYFTYHIG